tara:strand:+ start:444 stop:1136 length:693 start_codon:yes stop_codon:yes gene_type:complete
MDDLFKVVLAVIIFLAGLYLCLNYSTENMYEGFDNKNVSCPDVLIKQGNELILKNSKLAEIPGVNPIKFKNLEEYTEFVEWQRSQGITCPVLFMQYSYDAQGKNVLTVRPDPHDTQGGLPPSKTEAIDNTNQDLNSVTVTAQKNYTPYQLPPKRKLLDASRDDPPYNNNQYPGFDPENMYVGVDVPLDKIYHQSESNNVSDNAMDTNWGGVNHSNRVVDSGYYEANTRKM